MTKSTIIFLLVAALVLGALIGTSVATAPAAPDTSAARVHSGKAVVFRFFEPGELEVAEDEFGRIVPSSVGENFVREDGGWTSEALEIEIPPFGAVEYKAILDQGNAIVFGWETDAGQVYFDFHAHDAAFGEGFFTRYEEGEAVRQSGSIVAPYGGEHGWYWQSLEDEPIIVKLKVAGFYQEIVRLDVGTADGR